MPNNSTRYAPGPPFPLGGMGFATLLILAALVAGCTSTGRFIIPELFGNDSEAPPDSLLEYTVFLVGDAGYLTDNDMPPALEMLKRHLDSASEAGTVVFLGDNIYPSGLPPVTDPDYEEARRRLTAQIDAVKEYRGKVVFIPGNHDWGGAGLGGNRAKVRRQEDFVEAALDKGNAFLPDNGYPGPVEAPLTDSLVLIALDTQWWFEDVKPFGDTGQYQLEQEAEFILELNNALNRHAGKQIIVVGHHPVFSNGEHGGRFPNVRMAAPFTRRYLGTPQDFSSLKYRRLRQNLLAVFSRHPGLIYAAGHDHNLQYFREREQHYIVSGSGSKQSYVAQGYGAAFAVEEKGFAALHYYQDGSAWLTYYVLDADDPEGRVAYRTRIREATRPLPESVSTSDYLASTDSDASAIQEPSEPDSGTTVAAESASADTERPRPPVAGVPYVFVAQDTVTFAAGPHYRLGGLRETFLGSRYRNAWSTPVPVPVIDLDKTAGGLTPLQLGGGLQTKSLRLLGADGDQYVLRSIDKDPTQTVPDYLQLTIAQDVVRDQVSAMHPYAAFVLPPLAEAAGIYHTSPQLVYVPPDPRLGPYKDEFGGTLALFESRPDEDQSDESRFGFAENVIGTTKLLEEIEQDNDERVDERAFARARLFDMYIGDWDRHVDQWRWAEFDRTPGKLYRPIPRDRDFAFFRFNGLLARLARLSGVPEFRRFTNFSDEYNDLYGLNYNGSPLDKRFTASLTETDWMEIADSIRQGITDEVIDSALTLWPEPIYQSSAEEFAEILKARRDRLPEAARRYYRMLADEVDIVGSDKHERFEVTRLNDRETEVIVYKTQKEGDIDRELFRRTFRHAETDEIRLYGLGGNDQFIIRGSAGRGLLVRAIGGEGEDTFVDESHVSGPRDRTVFYDSAQGNVVEAGSETQVRLSDEPDNNLYQMLRLEKDLLGPVIRFSRNSDMGYTFGGGFRTVLFGFRERPYAVSHEAALSYSTYARGLNASYRGIIPELWRGWAGRLKADLTAERNYRFFYGLGNETDEINRHQYQAQIGQVVVEPVLQRRTLPFTTFSLGPRFSFTSVDRRNEDIPTAYTDADFVDTYFMGLHSALDIDGRDTLTVTRSGARWLNRADINVGVRNTSAGYVRLYSEASYFYTYFVPSPLTLAVRVGAARNFGSFAFFQANTLGGSENLRGFGRTRFSGRSMAFTNLELRAKLLDFNAYLTRGEAGLLGFFDNGRVWADGEESGKWHQGVGGGVWVTPFYQFVITGTVGVSQEDSILDVSFGFFF